MTPPRSIITTIFDSAWVRHPSRRRIGSAVAAALLVVLCFFPRSYVAKAELSPQESGGGLSAMLSGGANGGGLNLGALLGQRQSIEGELAISRSHAVVQDVVKRMRLVERGLYHDADQAEVKLKRKVNVEAVRGSIIQIRVIDHDPAFARDVAAGYSDAIRERLAALSLSQAAEKRAVAENRLAEAQINLAKAQSELNDFRETNKLASPEAQLGAAVTQLALLQARLQAKQVQLSTLLQFATDENVEVRAVRAEIASLQASISQAQTASGGAGAANLAAMSAQQSTYMNLVRNERFRQILFDIYNRYLESVEIDELTAGNNVEMIEPAYVDPEWHINILAEGLLAALLLVAGAAEFYVLRPPAGSPVRNASAGSHV